ncbi:glycosyltransferase [Christensenellaceae bacterium OttesenSCG-928-K19]|nr:glycosyltransferase [Christensenellaceae bacterium OttesenSCG-928-K19]
MKIAWFTPFDEKSSIGSVSKPICEELQLRGNDVTVYAPDTGKMIPSTVSVVTFSASLFDVAELDQYDHIVYNLGNFAGYHGDIYRVLQKKAGVVVLHDRTMNSLVRQQYKEMQYGGSEEAGFVGFEQDMVACYGENAKEDAHKIYHQTEEDEGIVELICHYSMLPLVLRNAAGVFTHAGQFAQKLAEEYYGPVGWAYLPYKAPRICRAMSPTEDERLLIVSNGIVHKVKRNHVMAEVLREYPALADRIRFVIVGSYGGSYGEKLERLAKNELRGCMELLGYQPYETMETYLCNADICVNLRNPNSEVCSLSLFEQMGYGAPTVVLDTGIYGEMPADSVVKISRENEKEELRQKLEFLLDHPDERMRVGKNAKQFIERECSVQKYVDNLTSFLATYQADGEYKLLVGKTLNTVAEVLRETGVSNRAVSYAVDDLDRQYEALFCAEPEKAKTTNKTLGVWFGFGYPIPNLRREGISRFMGCLVRGMLSVYDEIEVEVWTYEFNKKEAEAIFEAVQTDPSMSKRLSIITEKNWQKHFNVTDARSLISWGNYEQDDTLCYVAREFSRAQVFMPAIIYLDNVVGIGKPIVVPAHDMAVSYHFDDFVSINESNKALRRDIESRAKRIVRAGAKMVSASEFVRKEHILASIAMREEDTYVVPFPVFESKMPEDGLIPENELRQRFDLQGRYLFYPSQIRPHKNMARMFYAFREVLKKHQDIRLVLTGNVADVPSAEKAMREYGVQDNIQFASNVSDRELFSLYRYSDGLPCGSLMEANFPTQATEALYCKKPLTLSLIPVVEERIRSLGMTAETCGLNLFDPYNEDDFASKLLCAVENGEQIVRNQQEFADKLLTYTWDDAARAYYEILFEM